MIDDDAEFIEELQHQDQGIVWCRATMSMPASATTSVSLPKLLAFLECTPEYDTQCQPRQRQDELEIVQAQPLPGGSAPQTAKSVATTASLLPERIDLPGCPIHARDGAIHVAASCSPLAVEGSETSAQHIDEVAHGTLAGDSNAAHFSP